MFINNEDTIIINTLIMDRVTGIEPVSCPWQGHILTIILHPEMEPNIRIELITNPYERLVLPLN